MKIKVKKFDPSTDEAPYWAEGEVPYEQYMSALQALTAFRENVEPVSFDINCTGSLCGRCAVMLDGKPVLACVTPIDDADHTFEPLAGYPVIRDMVIDKSLFLDNVRAVQHRVKIDPLTEDDIIPANYSAEDDALMSSLELCVRCGLCNATCPALNEFPSDYVGPGVMVATMYRHLDPYDESDRVLEAVSNGLYRCIECGRCVTVCPRNDYFNHLELWTKLRSEAEARGLKPNYADAVAARKSEILANAPALVVAESVDCSTCHTDGKKAGDANPHGYK